MIISDSKRLQNEHKESYKTPKIDKNRMIEEQAFLNNKIETQIKTELKKQTTDSRNNFKVGKKMNKK